MKRILFALFSFFLSVPLFALPAEIKLTPLNQESIVYSNENAVISVEITNPPLDYTTPLEITVFPTNLTSPLLLDEEYPNQFYHSITPKNPGQIKINARFLDRRDNTTYFNSKTASACVIVRPYEIRAALPPPADFLSFWEKELNSAFTLPLTPSLIPIQKIPQNIDTNHIDAAEYSLPCTGSYPATGFILKPRNAKPKSLPIMVIFQGATGSAPHPSWYYSDVAITITPSKFGLPCQLSRDEYIKLGFHPDSGIYRLSEESATSLTNNIFKWMIIRDMRAIQYAKSLPEWDGKILISNGESLGGAQAIACGSLDPDVSFICACVPALSDHFGYLKGRQNGWPKLINDKTLPEKIQQISSVAPYIDTVNFLSFLTPNKEISIGTGLLDDICPAEGIFAAYNAIPTNVTRHIYVNPFGAHESGNKHGGKRIAEIIGK